LEHIATVDSTVSVQTEKPVGATISISTNVVSSVIKQSLNTKFNYVDALSAGINWQNSAFPAHVSNFYGQSATYDLQFLFQGFVNIVDQNNQPIPPSKVIFYCVGTNTEQVAFASQPDLATEEAVSLEVVLSTNSIVVQWPSYAANYQLETTTNLANDSWTTISLPTPIQAGPFLQVTFPVTNSCAFFRLQQIN
jgi:hypothetical protein